MNVEKIRCFIPIGGMAKRLSPLTHYVSKPCVRFLNRPLIEFSMAALAKQGVRNFIFGEQGYTNYTNLFDQYREGIGFSTKYNIKPRVHIKHQPNLDDLGSADSYRSNMEYYDIHDPVLVVQGDNLFELDLDDFTKRHEDTEALITIALVNVKKVEEYGVAELDKDSRIRRFIEKPKPEEAPTNLVNAGLYLLSPEVREIVQSDEVRKILKSKGRLDFGFDLIPYLVDNGFPVYSYKLKVWYDIGTPEKYLKALNDILYGKLDILASEERIMPDRNIWVQGQSEESVIRREEIVKKCKEKKLFITGTALIGRHTRIGDYSEIIDSNIDNFCILGEHSSIGRSAIMDATKIGDYCHIKESIIGRKVIVESDRDKPTYIESTSVIGNSVHIRKGCRLLKTRVNPGLTIPPGMTYENQFLKDYEDVVQLAK